MTPIRLILTIGLLLSPLMLKAQDASPVSETVSFSLLPASNQLAGEGYDANGNQTSDSALGIVSVKFNLLNLPEVVTYSDSTKVYYLYSASGSKLKEVVVPGGEGETETTDYTGNLIYKNGALHKVLTNGGYIETGDSTLALLNRPAYRYFLTDHLGSVRVVADAQGHVLQQDSQLPYGEDYTPVYASGHAQGGGFTPLPGEPPTAGGTGSGSGNDIMSEPDSYYRSYNPYKFSGKEQIKSGHYDFGARWYSPRAARWSTQDPLAEKYYSISPYAYCAGNPINLVDPNGLSPIYNENGVLLGTDDQGLQGDAFFMSENEFKQGMSHEDALNNNQTQSYLKDDSAVNAFNDSFNNLSSRPDWDGYLTLNEVNDWYRNGNGQPLFVSSDKIDLSQISLEDVKGSKDGSVSLLKPSLQARNSISYPESGLVYGQIQITIADEGSGMVILGRKSDRLLDTYNFEMHPWNSFKNIRRNILTFIGGILAGSGKDFNIYTYGYGHVNRK